MMDVKDQSWKITEATDTLPWSWPWCPFKSLQFKLLHFQISPLCKIKMAFQLSYNI